MEENYLNLAGYRFFELPDPEAMVGPMKEYCEKFAVKGTILTSAEGLNIMVAGAHSQASAWATGFCEAFGFPKIEWKKSVSSTLPFRRLFIKVKAELIPLGRPWTMAQCGDYLAPRELKKWLDEKKDFQLLDTRNQFEVELGKFSTAEHLSISSFRQFAEEAEKISDKEKPLVMYCTGGIRCEKASAYLRESLGFKEVYQLHGGILKYLKDCGQEHFEGECFVFDNRVSVDSQLKPTGRSFDELPESDQIPN